MELTKEELKSLIQQTVRETLEAYFGQGKSQQEEKEDYKTVFSEAMSQVARGELSEEEAGARIAEAHQKMSSPKNYSQNDLETQFEQFKHSVASWEQEISQLKGEGESAEDLLHRMKSKAETADAENKKALELKRMNEEAAKAKAELSLQQMKDKLNKK